MRSLILFVSALVFGSVCTVSAGGQSATPPPPPDKTLPPANEHMALTLFGRGVQIYTCQQAAGQFQWQFVAPSAHLFTSGGQEVGTHGDGPMWSYKDGSSIHGQVEVKQASSEAGSIPWLLLKAISPSGSGVLTSIDLIRRSDTHGGAAPVTGCSAGHLNQKLEVPYTATYTFYSSR